MVVHGGTKSLPFPSFSLQNPNEGPQKPQTTNFLRRDILYFLAFSFLVLPPPQEEVVIGYIVNHQTEKKPKKKQWRQTVRRFSLCYY